MSDKHISTLRKIIGVLAIMLPIAASQVPLHIKHASGAKPPGDLGMYDGYRTPAWILQGIAMAESGENDGSIGDDGISLGRMQLNERFHRERADKYGEYDPFAPGEAIRIASCIYQEYLERTGNSILAIMAYRQGIGGLNQGHGYWYYEKVRRARNEVRNPHGNERSEMLF